MDANELHVKKVMDLARLVIPYFERTFFNRYIQDYKDYLGYKADRQREIEDWQTNVVFTSTAGLVDTMYASIYDSKLKFGVRGEGILGTDKLLNNIFDFEGKAKKALMSSVKECIITGKAYLKPYLMAYKEKKIVRGKNYGKVVKRIMIDYVSIFNVFYDYNGSIEDSPFLIERYILNEKQILHRYGSKIGTNAQAVISAITKQPVKEQFSQYDINRVKHIISYESIIRDKKNKINTTIPTTLTSTGELNDDINNRNNIFAVEFSKNKVYEVIEHSDDDEVSVIIDGKLLVKVKKTLGIDMQMIQSISFNEIPGTTDSLGIGSMNRDTQQISNTLFNIYLDNLKMSIAPMFESVGGMNSFLGASNKLVYSPYRVVPTNTPGSLRKLDLNIAGFEPINTIQFMTTAARENIGISEQIMGAQGKIERISGGPEMLLNQFKSRLLPMTNSVMTAMGRIAKILLIMSATYFKESELKEMGLEDKLDMERFLDEKNITFNMSALSILDNEERLNYLSENLAAINNLGRGEDGKPTVNIQEVMRAILTKTVDVEAILKPRMPNPQNFEAKPGTVGAPGFPPMDALAAQGGTENPLQKPDQTPQDLANELSKI